MPCPECGESVEVPRAAFFGPGEHETVCPNGHQVVVVNRPVDGTTVTPE
jgi:hypothetical protein